MSADGQPFCRFRVVIAQKGSSLVHPDVDSLLDTLGDQREVLVPRPTWTL